MYKGCWIYDRVSYYFIINWYLGYIKNHTGIKEQGFDDNQKSNNATFCQDGFFRCNFGFISDTRYAKNDFEREHIPAYKRCDGIKDCADGSDEEWINEECKQKSQKNDTKCQLTIEEGLKFCGIILKYLNNMRFKFVKQLIAIYY